MLTHPSLLLLLLVSTGHCSKLTRPHSPTRDAREILGGMSDRLLPMTSTIQWRTQRLEHLHHLLLHQQPPQHPHQQPPPHPPPRLPPVPGLASPGWRTGVAPCVPPLLQTRCVAPMGAPTPPPAGCSTRPAGGGGPSLQWPRGCARPAARGWS